MKASGIIIFIIILLTATGCLYAQQPSATNDCCSGLSSSPASAYNYFNSNPGTFNEPGTITETATGVTHSYETFRVIDAQGRIQIYAGQPPIVAPGGENVGFAEDCRYCPIETKAYKFLDTDNNGKIDQADYPTKEDMLKAFFQKTLFRTLSPGLNSNPYVEITVERVEVNCDDCSWGFIPAGSDPKLLSQKALNSQCGSEICNSNANQGLPDFKPQNRNPVRFSVEAPIPRPLSPYGERGEKSPSRFGEGDLGG